MLRLLDEQAWRLQPRRQILQIGGALRVQYMGVRFDPDEMLRDLRSLLREGGR